MGRPRLIKKITHPDMGIVYKIYRDAFFNAYIVRVSPADDISFQPYWLDSANDWDDIKKAIAAVNRDISLEDVTK